jgi:outer membrane protein assembly factor BamB
MAGRQVFICAAAEDAGYYGELITALNAWEVPHTEMGVVPNPVISMPPTIESEIRQCEVFLRVCTIHTRQSNAVKLATDFFQQALNKDRRGPNQRRRLVNLILDPAYLLDDEEKKTLYIMAPGKSRPLWLEELSVSVGAATLTQQLSRRALFGMGAGAAVAVASAGVAGTLLVKQFRSQQPPPLPVQQSISGNPRFNFNLIPEPMKNSAFDPARVFQDGAAVYAQPVLSSDSFDKLTDVVDDTVYVLTATNGQKRPIKIPALPDYQLNQSELIAANNGVLLFHNLSPDAIPLAPTQTTIVRAVRVSDGKQLWKVTTAAHSAPAIADGVLYLVFQDVTKVEGGSIYYETSLNAFSMKDGSRLWRNTDYSFDTILTPAAANRRLYIGSYFDQDHNVYCLDAKTGKKVWTYLTGGAVLGTPTVANGVVYVGSQDNALYALDARTGALRWRFAGSLTFLAAPLAHDGVVYAPSQDGYIYALDARTGTMFWRAFAGVHPATDSVGFGTLTAQAAIYRNVLFAPTGNALYAFDLRHGTQRWQYIPVSDGDLTAPVISDGLVLVGAADNHVYAVNP